jgi:hypothetical protein
MFHYLSFNPTIKHDSFKNSSSNNKQFKVALKESLVFHVCCYVNEFILLRNGCLSTALTLDPEAVESINSPLCRTGTQLSTFMVGLLPLGF